MSNGVEEVGRGRPKDDAKRVAIVQAAKRLFLAQPYDRVSVEAIAEAAGVSKVTVYSHFSGGKEDVFVAAIGGSCEIVFDQTLLQIDVTGDFEAALRQLGADFVRMITNAEIAGLHQVILAEGARDPRLPQLFYDQVVKRSTMQLADRLAKEAAKGVIDCPDPVEAAEQFLALVQGEFVYRFNLGLGRGDPDAMERYCASSVRLFLRGLRP
jgi:TetR/AcrR family transcriptional repressor of mexJK operon